MGLTLPPTALTGSMGPGTPAPAVVAAASQPALANGWDMIGKPADLFDLIPGPVTDLKARLVCVALSELYLKTTTQQPDDATVARVKDDLAFVKTLTSHDAPASLEADRAARFAAAEKETSGRRGWYYGPYASYAPVTLASYALSFSGQCALAPDPVAACRRALGEAISAGTAPCWSSGAGPFGLGGDGARDVVRALFPNPYRALPDAADFIDDEVIALVEDIQSSGSFARMGELGTLLAARGCQSPEVLNHCSSRGPFFQGDFVIDWLAESPSFFVGPRVVGAGA